MVKICMRVVNRVQSEDGQDMVEYALLLALISVVCILAIAAGGSAISAVFSGVVAPLVSVAS